MLRFIATASLAMLLFPALLSADEELQPITPEKVELDGPVDYQRDIVPMMDNKCVACHNVAIDESGLNLESVEDMIKGGRRGAAIVPGKPDESLLYLVAARAKAPAMPPLPNDVESTALTPRELGLLRQWILEGASKGGDAAGPQITWHSVPSSLNSIYSVALSPWSRYAAAARANQIDLYDLATAQHVARLNDPHLSELKHEEKPLYPQGAAHRDFVHSLAFSPDGNWIASGGYRMVKLWQRTIVQEDRPALDVGTVRATAESTDGKWGAVAGESGKVVIYPLAAAGEAFAADQVQRWSAEGAPIAALTLPNEAHVVLLREDGSLQICNRGDGAVVRSWPLPAAGTSAVSLAAGPKLAVGDKEGTIRIWTLESLLAEAEALPAAEKELKGHAGPVLSLAVQPGENGALVSGGQDGTLRIWNLANGQQVRSNGHGAPVRQVAVRADAGQFISVGENNLAKLWDAAGKSLADLKTDLIAQRLVIAATEDETVAKQVEGLADTAVKNAEKDVTDRQGSLDKAKKDLEELKKKVTEAEEAIKKAQEAAAAAKMELEAKPDDEALKKKQTDADAAVAKAEEEVNKAKANVASGERSVKLAEESLARVTKNRDAAKEAHAAAVKQREAATAALKSAQEAAGAAVQPVHAARFVDDGRLVAVAGAAGRVAFFASADGKPVELRTRGDEKPVAALQVTPSGGLVEVAADGSVSATAVHPEWKLAGWLGPPADDSLNLSASPFIDRVLCLAFSPDGKLLATGGGEPSRSGELLIWDLEQRTVVKELIDAHSDTVFGVEFSRDGKRLLSGGADKFAKVFDVATGEFIRGFEGHTSHVLDVSWKANGSQIATSGADNAIKIWNVETGEQIRTITSHAKQVPSLEHLSTGDEIVSVGGDATVRMHRSSNGQNFRNLGGAADYVYAVDASRDGKLVIAGGEDGTLRVWNAENGQVIHSFAPAAAEENKTAQVNR